MVDVVFRVRALRLGAVAAVMVAALFVRLVVPAYASSVSEVSIAPINTTAGVTTSYTIRYQGSAPLFAGDTITVDWSGDGVAPGVIQQHLPAAVTFNADPSVRSCAGTVGVVDGNTVVSLMDSGGTCAISSALVQFNVTNVRNPKYSAGRAGGIRTSRDVATANDLALLTWYPLGLTITAAGTHGTGADVATVPSIGGAADIDIYTSGLEIVTVATTRGVLAGTAARLIVCRDGDFCDADHLLNGILVVTLGADGTAGPATITAQSSDRAMGALRWSATVVFTGPVAAVSVVSDLGTIAPDGRTRSAIVALVTDADGNSVADGTPVVFSTDLGTVSPVSSVTVGGRAVATYTATSRGTATVSVVAGGVGASVRITVTGQTIPVGQSLFCFTYSGPAAAVANFAAFFNGAIDGVNVQASDGSYTSWFRALPSAATIGSIASDARLCVGGTPGTTVFA
jgi:hypothetical protein